MDDTHRLNLSAGLASVGGALLLVALKLWALAATGALSVAASLDQFGARPDRLVGRAVGILYAARPPDEDHSFGHSSVEDLVALGQALLVAASAAAIGWGAIGRLADAAPAGAAEAGARGHGALGHGHARRWCSGRGGWRGAPARVIVAADRLHYLSDLLPALGAMVALVAAVALRRCSGRTR